MEHEELGTQGACAGRVRRAKGHLRCEFSVGHQAADGIKCNYTIARAHKEQDVDHQTANANANTSGGASTGSRPHSPATAREDTFDYSDISTLQSTGKVACLLCQRRFPSVEALKKHDAGSDLHKVHPRSETRQITILNFEAVHLGPALSSFGVWVPGLTNIVTDAISSLMTMHLLPPPARSPLRSLAHFSSPPLFYIAFPPRNCNSIFSPSFRADFDPSLRYVFSRLLELPG